MFNQQSQQSERADHIAVFIVLLLQRVWLERGKKDQSLITVPKNILAQNHDYFLTCVFGAQKRTLS